MLSAIRRKFQSNLRKTAKLSLADIFAASVNMGNGMNKILPGLYIGNFRDAKDTKQLAENNITHIVAIHDNAKKILDDKEYLCILASDSPDQDLVKFFPQVNKFIHKARLEGGSVLVHCLAGVSRSVTVTAAYIMTATSLGWRDSLNAIRGARSVANPNFGFQKQLQYYENESLEEERKKLRAMFPSNPFRDDEECQINLRCFQQYLATGSLPSRSDDLYPLPHRAYEGHARKEASSRQKPAADKSSEESKENVDDTPPHSSSPGVQVEEEEEEDNRKSGGKQVIDLQEQIEDITLADESLHPTQTDNDNNCACTSTSS